MYGGWWNSGWWPVYHGWVEAPDQGWWNSGWVEAPDQGWAKAPQGEGRGVGPSPDASTGKGCKGAKIGKGGTEAPAGKGRGVGPSPYASKGKDPKGKGRGVGPSPDASTGKGCKGAKDGKGGTMAPAERKKRSEMSSAERCEAQQKHRAKVLLRRTGDAPVARCRWINSFRTPVGHRFGHKRPKECSRATGGFSMILA